MDINDIVRLDIHVTGKVVGKTIESSPRVDIVVDLNGYKLVLPNIPTAWLQSASRQAA
ncbi:MAG: hypothetical protein WCF16_11125 [Alphaproteobacteria bacterium]